MTTDFKKLIQALVQNTYEPYLRGVPPGLPFQLDEETLKKGLNFTLTTALGAIDLLDEITGGENYTALLPSTVELNLFGNRCLCINLKKLINVKKAAGPPKDLETIAELEALIEESES